MFKLLEEVAELRRIVAVQRDEIARLKGGPGRPNIKPSGMEKATEPRPGKRGGRRRGRGSTKAKLSIHEEQTLKAEAQRKQSLAAFETARRDEAQQRKLALQQARKRQEELNREMERARKKAKEGSETTVRRQAHAKAAAQLHLAGLAHRVAVRHQINKTGGTSGAGIHCARGIGIRKDKLPSASAFDAEIVCLHH